MNSAYELCATTDAAVAKTSIGDFLLAPPVPEREFNACTQEGRDTVVTAAAARIRSTLPDYTLPQGKRG